MKKKEILKSYASLYFSKMASNFFCDISPIGGTKQLGIDQFLEYYGLDLKDTMAL